VVADAPVEGWRDFAHAQIAIGPYTILRDNLFFLNRIQSLQVA